MAKRKVHIARTVACIDCGAPGKAGEFGHVYQQGYRCVDCHAKLFEVCLNCGAKLMVVKLNRERHGIQLCDTCLPVSYLDGAT